MKTASLFFTVLFSLSVSVANGQENETATKTDRDYGKLETVHSPSMNRDLPVLVFLPSDYASSGKNYPVIYFLHGTNDQPLTEKGLRTLYSPALGMKETADIFHVIIVTPIVGNSYYLDSPVKKESLFATYTGVELPAFVDSHYRTLANREGRILAGFSMGGYGAVSLLCRYPDTFSVALERSGVMNPATGIEDLDWDDTAIRLTCWVITGTTGKIITSTVASTW